MPYTSAMHALVAGATGFIGGELVRRLLADGADVRALVRDRRRARTALAEDPRLELFVEAMPLGEQSVAVGVGLAL